MIAQSRFLGKWGAALPLNEADTRAQLIDPKLEATGWGATQIGREHFYRRDVQYTAGRIVLRGERAYHRGARKVDYVLRYTEGFLIAVVEALASREGATVFLTTHNIRLALLNKRLSSMP